MLKPRRWLFGAMAVTVAMAALPMNSSPASADPFGRVDCAQEPDHPVCQVEAGTPEEPGTPAVGGDGEVECRQDGEVVPCFTDDGWLGADGCRYLQIDAPPPPGAVQPGAAYRVTCPGDPAGSQRPAVWLSDAEAPGPAELARIAVSRLALPRPEVELSPPLPAPQLVMLPTWLWIEPQWWTARSASASVPGITVTAVATPVQVRWRTGDGAEYTCDAGTPYAAGRDPVAASPDCGHTYTRGSASQPGGVYRVTATVTWQVTWSGAGVSGTVDPLFSTTTVPVQVLESRSVNTRAQP